MPQRALSNPERPVVQNDGNAEGSNIFVGFLRVLADKTPSKLKNASVVKYPTHVVLAKWSAKYHCSLTVNAHTVVCILLVSLASDIIDSWSIHEEWLKYLGLQAHIGLMPKKHDAYSDKWMHNRRLCPYLMTLW